eukprot:11519516-Alexandrium_andersonii.AAC.1
MPELVPAAAAASGSSAGDLAVRPSDGPGAGYNPATRTGPAGPALADEDVPSFHPARHVQAAQGP